MRHRFAGWGFGAVATLLAGVATAEPAVFEDLVAIESPIKGVAQEPYIAAAGDALVMSWMAPKGSDTYVQFARLESAGWSDPVTVVRGDDLFVNWADFPSVMPFGDAGIAVHWLRKAGRSGYDYNVELAISRDQGATWSAPMVPHSDRSEAQHGFVTMNGAPDGSLDLLWLDGRAYGKVGLQDSPDAMQLRATRFDPGGGLMPDRAVDIQTCSCCQTSSARLGDGSLVVAYRDRTDAEIRDISVVRLNNDTWSGPVSVHEDGWEISGCPVNGPAIAAQDTRVAVAWYTGADDVAAVKVAFSDDGGAHFGAPARIDLGEPLGRVDALFLEDGSVLVTWLEWQGDDEVLMVCRAVAGQGCVTRQELARNAAAGSMNFPRMARSGGDVYLAWTEPVDAYQSTVRIMRGTPPAFE